MKYATEFKSNDWLYECYKVQSMIDAGRGNYKSALENHQLYLALKDSVYQSQYDEKMAAMQSFYEVESKEKTIRLLEKDQEVKTAELSLHRLLLGLGLLSALTIFFANRYFHQRKTAKMRVVFAQELLNTQENERQRIARELHDSIGQQVLFIKNRLTLTANDDPQLKNSVDTALEEIRNIAKDLYPNQLETYGLSAAVATLCETVQIHSGIFASSDLEGVDDQLTREAKINCYRIIQECINNTIKHSEATAIRISSELRPGKIELVVQDNGKGFEKSGLARKSNRSFGLLNIQERIHLLKGKFDLETSFQKGVKFTFAIPTT